MKQSLAVMVSVLAAIACLSSASLSVSRCPGNSSNASYYSESGSGILDLSCAELATDGSTGLVYFCQSGTGADFNCSSSNYTCEFCERVRECMPSSEELFDLCSNTDLIVNKCTQLEQFDNVNVQSFFVDLCGYADSVCFTNASTGICSEELTRECSSLHDGEYPCDCFEPNATCDRCSFVLNLCGGGSASGSGSAMPSCSDFFQADGNAGAIFLCQNFTNENSCPYSPYTCSVCRFVLDCDFPQHQLPDLCSDAGIIRACLADFSAFPYEAVVFYGDVCPYIPLLCLLSLNTGICQADGLVDDCSEIITQNQPCTFVASFSEDLCTLCNSLLYLCDPTSGIVSGISGSGISGFSGISGSGISGSGISGSGISGSGISGSGISGSGSGISGSGIVFPCSVFEDDLGIVFFCQTVVNSGLCFSSYSNITCDFCYTLTFQCDLPPSNLRDLCSDSDALLPCGSQTQQLNPSFRAFTRDLCSFAFSECLQNPNTGICDAHGVLMACRDVEEADTQCDTLIPVETCIACRRLLLLCQPPRTTTLLPSSTLTTSPSSASSSPLSPSTSPPSPSTSPPSTSTSPPATSTTSATSTTTTTSADTTTPPVQPTSSVIQTTASPTTSATEFTTTSTVTEFITTSSAVATSEKPTAPSPTPPTEPPTFPEGTAIEVDSLSQEETDNAINIELGGLTADEFLQKEVIFRETLAAILNLISRKRQSESTRFTSDDVKYVGEPVTTEQGSLVIAFFVELPTSEGVVMGERLATAVENSQEEINNATGGMLLKVERGIPDALQPGTTDTSDKGLSGGGIAGIVIALLVVAAGIITIAVVAVFVVRRRKIGTFSPSHLGISGDGTFDSDTFEARPHKAIASDYVPMTESLKADTLITNEGAMSQVEKEAKKEAVGREKEKEVGDSEKSEIDTSKNTHL